MLLENNDVLENKAECDDQMEPYEGGEAKASKAWAR